MLWVDDGRNTACQLLTLGNPPRRWLSHSSLSPPVPLPARPSPLPRPNPVAPLFSSSLSKTTTKRMKISLFPRDIYYKQKTNPIAASPASFGQLGCVPCCYVWSLPYPPKTFTHRTRFKQLVLEQLSIRPRSYLPMKHAGRCGVMVCERETVGRRGYRRTLRGCARDHIRH